jgi:hypothetical protein
VSLNRAPLYPDLRDHERVKEYGDVRGLRHNVFFLDHRNREDGNEELMSKRNTYEVCSPLRSEYGVTDSFKVAMIKDLVLYLLRSVILPLRHHALIFLQGKVATPNQAIS